MLAIEVGRIYSAHRQLQKAATLAALDAARVVSGCTATPTQASLNNAMSTSLALNGFPSGSLLSSVAEYGTIATSAGQIRSLKTTGLSGITDPQVNGARVTLTASFPTPLIPLLPSTSSNMRASATASQSALGSLRVGSGVASLSGGVLNSLLSALVGGNVNLSLADYQGLANVTVTASQLATALGVSVTDLSNPTTLNNTVLLGASLTGLTSALSGGVVNPQVTSTLQTLAGQTTNTNPIPLGSILGPVGSVAPDVPFVNLQDLVMALATASQSDPSGIKSIELKNIGLDVPGVATVKVFAKILQPAQFSGLGRPGQTKASTAQITLLIRIQAGSLITSVTGLINTFVSTVGALSSLLGISVTSSVLPQLNIGVDVAVAPATAYLDRVDCPRSGTNNGQPVAGMHVKTALATVAVGTFAGSASAAPSLDTSTTGWTLAQINVKVCPLGICAGTSNNRLTLGLTKADVSSSTTVLNDVYQFTAIPSLYPKLPAFRANGAPGNPTVPAASPVSENPQTVGSATSATVTLTSTNDTTGSSGLIGAVVGPLLNTLLTTISGLVQSLVTLVNGLATSLINPLLAALGVQLGTATTFMDTVTVGQPYLVTTALP